MDQILPLQLLMLWLPLLIMIPLLLSHAVRRLPTLGQEEDDHYQDRTREGADLGINLDPTDEALQVTATLRVHSAQLSNKRGYLQRKALCHHVDMSSGIPADANTYVMLTVWDGWMERIKTY